MKKIKEQIKNQILDAFDDCEDIDSNAHDRKMFIDYIDQIINEIVDEIYNQALNDAVNTIRNHDFADRESRFVRDEIIERIKKLER